MKTKGMKTGSVSFHHELIREGFSGVSYLAIGQIQVKLMGARHVQWCLVLTFRRVEIGVLNIKHCRAIMLFVKNYGWSCYYRQCNQVTGVCFLIFLLVGCVRFEAQSFLDGWVMVAETTGGWRMVVVIMLLALSPAWPTPASHWPSIYRSCGYTISMCTGRRRHHSAHQL